MKEREERPPAVSISGEGLRMEVKNVPVARSGDENGHSEAR
jgi:hypothetical protein